MKRLPGPRSIAIPSVLIVCTVVLQRFALPFGDGIDQVPLILPVQFVLLGLAWLRNDALFDGRAVMLYAAFVGTCLAMALVNFGQGYDGSLNSLTLLVVTYLPTMLVFHPGLRASYPLMLRTFRWLMILMAAVGLFQWALQIRLGTAWQDPIGRIVPARWLYHPNSFNVDGVVAFGNILKRVNGVLFLEPSFFSQFVALATAIELIRRRPNPIVLALYAVAIVASVSGTGLLLLVFLVPLLARRYGVIRMSVVVGAIGVAAAIALQTTPGKLVVDRQQTEANSSQSSLTARFIEPYTLTMRSVREEPGPVLIGHGPGNSTSYAADVYERTGSSPLFAALPKMQYEYGLVAFGVYLLMLGYHFFYRQRDWFLSVGGLLIYLFLSGNLLFPPIVALAWLLGPHFREIAVEYAPATPRHRLIRRRFDESAADRVEHATLARS